MAFNVVIHAGYEFPEYASVIREVQEYLRAHNIQNTWVSSEKDRSAEATIRTTRGFDGVIAGAEIWNEHVFQQLEGQLKIVARFGIGYDVVDLQAATKRGIPVTNTPGACSRSVADMAFALLMTVKRRTHLFDARLKSGQWWTDYVGQELADATVGLVGFGDIARQFAKYLQGFECRILAFDPYFDRETAAALHVEYADLPTICRESDYISLHVSLNEGTKGLVNRNFLQQMKPSAYLINTSRGKVIVEADLIEALRQHEIAGAGLDVFEQEPLAPGNPLITFDNVVLTPHRASSTDASLKLMGFGAADNIIAFANGKLPPNVLNPEFINYTSQPFEKE
jgi:D-3-phosphoglycerate dehydrogenase